MKTKIHIDTEPFAETRYYSGVYEDQTEKEYSFTLAAQLDENSNAMFIVEITWTDDTPPDFQEIEKKIKDHWRNGG